MGCLYYRDLWQRQELAFDSQDWSLVSFVQGHIQALPSDSTIEDARSFRDFSITESFIDTSMVLLHGSIHRDRNDPAFFKYCICCSML